MAEPAIRPFLKWAGGKRALLPEILPRVPEFNGRYIEPFLGAGAVMFAMPAATSKIVNDFNADLVEVYQMIRDFPEEIIRNLRRHRNTKEHFLAVRSWDRENDFIGRDPIERAARFIFLNRTCFNGLYRVNSKGQFNVPFGNYAAPDLVLMKTIHDASSFLNSTNSEGSPNVEISSGDFREATSKARVGDFVYLDPPYDPVSATSSFVSYQQDGFGRADQVALRNEVLRLSELNVPVLLSNSDTSFIRELYADSSAFQIEQVTVSRAIGASSASRTKVGELLVNNFEVIR
jgi:DNA adenine methylase